MKQNISVIIFDLGRVLINIDFEAFPLALGLPDEHARQRYDQQKISLTVLKYETGESTTPEFIAELSELFRGDFSGEKIREAFDSIILSDNEEIVPFVNEVKKNHRIAALSNTCPSHMEKIFRMSDVIRSCTDIFTSYQLGAMKPAPIVYETAAATLGAMPSEILFIDDVEANVEGAVSAGMHGIVYRDFPQLLISFEALTGKKIDLK